MHTTPFCCIQSNLLPELTCPLNNTRNKKIFMPLDDSTIYC